MKCALKILTFFISIVILSRLYCSLNRPIFFSQQLYDNYLRTIGFFPLEELSDGDYDQIIQDSDERHAQRQLQEANSKKDQNASDEVKP